MDKQKIIIFADLLTYVGVMFMYEITQSQSSAYVLNRWTGSVHFIVGDKRMPVEDRYEED